MEDVEASNGTMWDDMEGFGRNFCVFLEGAVEDKSLKDVAAKTRMENSETQWAGKPALRDAFSQSP
jgi:hypothetical protein